MRHVQLYILYLALAVCSAHAGNISLARDGSFTELDTISFYATNPDRITVSTVEIIVSPLATGVSGFSVTSPTHPAFRIVSEAFSFDSTFKGDPNNRTFDQQQLNEKVNIRFNPFAAIGSARITDSLIFTSSDTTIVVHLVAQTVEGLVPIDFYLYAETTHLVSNIVSNDMLHAEMQRITPGIESYTVSQPTLHVFRVLPREGSDDTSTTRFYYDSVDGGKGYLRIEFDKYHAPRGVLLHDSVVVTSGNTSRTFAFSAIYNPVLDDLNQSQFTFDRARFEVAMKCGEALSDSLFIYNFSDDDMDVSLLGPGDYNLPLNLPINHTSGAFTVPAHGHYKIDLNIDTRGFEPDNYSTFLMVEGAFTASVNVIAKVYDTITTGWASEGPLRFRSLNMSFGSNDSSRIVAINRQAYITNRSSRNVFLDSLLVADYSSYVLSPNSTVSLPLAGLATGTYTFRMHSGMYTYISRILISN